MDPQTQTTAASHDDDDTQLNYRLILSDAEAQVVLVALEHVKLAPGARALADEVAARIDSMLRDAARVSR